ncbi:MAG: hypothetical protein ACE15F_10045 [bacterium]
MLETFTTFTFLPLMQERFRVYPDEASPLDLELVQFKILTGASPGSQPAAGRREPYSLHFRGPQSPVLPQKIYRFEHPALGAFEMFIVPHRSGAEGTVYEAIFT